MGPRLRYILLVEDDSNDAHLLQRAFSKAAIDVPIVRVRDGDDAVAYFSGEGRFVDRNLYPIPGLVLLDLKLPRRSGLDVLEWLRTRESDCRRLPVIMLSSSAEPQDIDRSYDLGANSYITKPQTSSGFYELAVAFRDYWIGINEDPGLRLAHHRC